jgi:hypothetical protein
MKPSTSINLTEQTLDSGISQLRGSPIESVYLWALPTRSAHVHGPSVEFFFPDNELAIGGEILQVGPKEEAFNLEFRKTMGLKYWRNEVDNPKETNVADAQDLTVEWKTKGLDALLAGPRDVRLYTRSNPVAIRGKLAGIEITAKESPQQRILIVASEDDPGDVVVITPSYDYEHAIAKLTLLQ